MTNSTTATVETLTAEVRVLMVGSRQVTLSVFGQLDTAGFDQIDPFGRVRPKNDNCHYIWLVGRHKVTGALVRARIPADDEAIDRAAGFSALEYDRLARAKDDAINSAERYEGYGDTIYSRRDGSGYFTASEEAARYREQAEQLRDAMAAMIREADCRREPLEGQAQEAETLPLIVLAGLR